jgi:hypothetical protein
MCTPSRRTLGRSVEKQIRVAARNLGNHAIQHADDSLSRFGRRYGARNLCKHAACIGE